MEENIDLGCILNPYCPLKPEFVQAWEYFPSNTNNHLAAKIGWLDDECIFHLLLV